MKTCAHPQQAHGAPVRAELVTNLQDVVNLDRLNRLRIRLSCPARGPQLSAEASKLVCSCVQEMLFTLRRMARVRRPRMAVERPQDC